jgi:hypothetical protein
MYLSKYNEQGGVRQGKGVAHALFMLALAAELNAVISEKSGE